VPLLAEALTAALEGIATVRRFPAERGDTAGLLRAVDPDAVVVDSEAEAHHAAVFARATDSALVHVSLYDQVLRITRPLLLAAVVVAALAFAGAANAERYIVLYKQHAVPADATRTVERAGGTIVAAYNDIGVVVPVEVNGVVGVAEVTAPGGDSIFGGDLDNPQNGKMRPGSVAAYLQKTSDAQPCPTMLPPGYAAFTRPHPAGTEAQLQECQGGPGHTSWYGNGQVNAFRAVTHD
jgi:hypothetical protein